MAFSKKGWRKIVVANEVFYWQPGPNLFLWGEFDLSNFLLHARLEREPSRHLVVIHACCGNLYSGFDWRVTPRIAQCCIECAVKSGWLADRPKLRMVLFDHLSCVVGDPKWRTPTVMQLATGIDNEQAFERLPILADALQDAGCDCDDILNHFRDPNRTHVRGCWALDLVLGKE